MRRQSGYVGRGTRDTWTTERAFVASALVAASVAFSGSASASATAAAYAASPSATPTAAPASVDQTVAATPRHKTFGVTMDVGVPDGAALGLVVRPRFDWLRIGASVTHNGMAPGVRFGVTLDPISFPVAPTLTVEGGHYWQGTVPTLQDSPTVGYNYANFHLGLEVGNRSTFRFFLRGGVSYVDISASNIGMGSAMSTTNMVATTSGSGLANPSFSGWLAPSGKLGFSLYF